MNLSHLGVRLRTAYLAKTKIIFAKSTVNKGKSNWNSKVRLINSTVGPMNSTKKCNRTHE